MKNLALAAICGVFHFELSDEEEVAPDAAVNAMEEIFFHLRNATPAEKNALAEALAELKVEAGKRKNKKELVEFYDAFLENLEAGADDEES